MGELQALNALDPLRKLKKIAVLMGTAFLCLACKVYYETNW